jgi:hypothetical protein
VRAEPRDRQAAIADAELLDDARQPFDLGRPPLLRARLVLLDGESWLYVNLHHVVCDGWAAGVLFGELLSLYEAFAAGRASPLPPLPSGYAEFARADRRRLETGALAADLRHWSRELDGLLPALPLAPDKPRPERRRHRGAKYPVRIPPAVTTALRDLARRERVTLFMALLAAFATVVRRHSGRDRLVIGTTCSNRDDVALEQQVGHFVTTVALPLRPAADLSFRRFLGHVRDVTLSGFAHQRTPIERVSAAMPGRPDWRRVPAVGVVFTLQNARLPDAAGTAGYEQLDNGTSKFDLVLNLLELDRELTGWLEYDTDLFRASTVATLADHFRDVLEAVPDAPDVALIDLPLSGQAGRHPDPLRPVPQFRFDAQEAVDA